MVNGQIGEVHLLRAAIGQQKPGTAQNIETKVRIFSYKTKRKIQGAMQKTGLLYTPIEGKALQVSHKLRSLLAEEDIDMLPARMADNDVIADYTNIIIGISTYSDSKAEIDLLNNPWDNFKQQLTHMHIAGKRFALFCIGDQEGYSNSFVNELKEIAEIIHNGGGEIVAGFPNENYHFQESISLINGNFIGLPLDEKNQPELTETRLLRWKDMLVKEFK